MRGIDVEGKRLSVRKRLDIRDFRGLIAKMRCVKNAKLLLRGNKSKGMILNATERFRCHSPASGQVRCQRFACGRFRCFLKNPGLCGRVECICYLSMIFVTFLLFMFMDRKL